MDFSTHRASVKADGESDTSEKRSRNAAANCRHLVSS